MHDDGADIFRPIPADDQLRRALRKVLDDYGVTETEEPTFDGHVRATSLVDDLARAALPKPGRCAICGQPAVAVHVDGTLPRDQYPDHAAALRADSHIGEGLREASRAMWFAHTEDERFAPKDGRIPADPYGDFERALLTALSKEQGQSPEGE